MKKRTEFLYKKNLPTKEEYFSLFNTTGWNEEYCLNAEELYISLSNTYYSVCVYRMNKLIGFGRVVSDGILHAMIYEMIVHPNEQGKGIGANILVMLLEKCFEDNIRDLQLFCAKGKRGFYEKYGFIARPDNGPGMDYKKS